ncbi:MAG: N-formylglutamate amidohydrolase [Proteobacteria bacterium]|nr:N-formylglutamate amidohydrolase [Pseudomonadota bacterium]
MIKPGILERIDPVGAPVPVLYTLPHSGRDYPADFNSALPPDILRRAEDAYVDRLLEGAEARGATVLKALFPRAYLDANRLEDDLDPALLPPGTPVTAGEKSKLGIGLVRRVVTPEFPIYDRLLSLDEIENRVSTYYRPYHETLGSVLSALHESFGQAVFIDWHSMKSVGNAATPDGAGATRPDFVLGDRHGKSCAPGLTRAISDYLTTQGYRVSVNDPYAGGATMQRYGAPKQGVHGLQIEMNRALYLDEKAVTMTDGVPALRKALSGVLPAITAFLG